MALLSQLEQDISKGYAFDPIFADVKFNHRWHFANALWFTVNDAIVVPDYSDLRQQIIAAHHVHPLSGHPGAVRTADAVKRGYWWKGIKCYGLCEEMP